MEIKTLSLKLSHYCPPAVMVLFAVLLLSIQATSAADVGVVDRKDVIHLKDGKTIEGSILISGPKGTSIITMKGERLEQFIEAKDIERIDREVQSQGKGKKDQTEGPEKIISHYQAEPLEGKLEVIDIGKGSPSDSADDGEKEEKLKPEKKVKKKKTPKRGFTPVFRPKKSIGDDEDKKQSKDDNDNLFGQNDKK